MRMRRIWARRRIAGAFFLVAAVLGVGLPTCAPESSTEDRFVYLWMPEAERHDTSQPVVCFILASLRMGPVRASDGGVATCARYGQLCGSKTTHGPFAHDTYPVSSRVEVAPSPLLLCRRHTQIYTHANTPPVPSPSGLAATHAPNQHTRTRVLLFRNAFSQWPLNNPCSWQA